METRMTHYANYRAQIRRMSEGSHFTATPDSSGEALLTAQAAEQTPFYPAPSLDEDVEAGKRPSGPNPYRDYLRRRRKVFIVQAIVFVLLAIGFTVWMILLKQRS